MVVCKKNTRPSHVTPPGGNAAEFRRIPCTARCGLGAPVASLGKRHGTLELCRQQMALTLGCPHHCTLFEPSGSLCPGLTGVMLSCSFSLVTTVPVVRVDGEKKKREIKFRQKTCKTASAGAQAASELKSSVLLGCEALSELTVSGKYCTAHFSGMSSASRHLGPSTLHFAHPNARITTLENLSTLTVVMHLKPS